MLNPLYPTLPQSAEQNIGLNFLPALTAFDGRSSIGGRVVVLFSVVPLNLRGDSGKQALTGFSEGTPVVDITPLIQSAVIIMAALAISPVLYVTVRLLRSDQSAFESARKLCGSPSMVWRGEVNPRVGDHLDPRVECGVTVEERRRPNGERYAVLLPQGKLSRDTVTGLFR